MKENWQFDEQMKDLYDMISEEFILTPAEEAIEDYSFGDEYQVKCRKCGWWTALPARKFVYGAYFIHDCLDVSNK